MGSKPTQTLTPLGTLWLLCEIRVWWVGIVVLRVTYGAGCQLQVWNKISTRRYLIGLFVKIPISSSSPLFLHILKLNKYSL